MIIGRSCTEKTMAGTYLRTKILCIKTINFFIQTDRISEKKFPTIVADSTVRPAMQQPASVRRASGELLRQLHMSGVRTIRIVAQGFQKIFEHQKMKLRESFQFFYFFVAFKANSNWQILSTPLADKQIENTIAACKKENKTYERIDANTISCSWNNQEVLRQLWFKWCQSK